MITLHTLLMTLQCVFATSVILSGNAVHSVIFLILTFCCSAFVLIFFTADFLALIFIVIYVGAIAILFLFVVMMLNVKEDSNNSISRFSNVGEIFILSLLLGIWADGFTSPDIAFQFDENLDGFSNIQSLGQFLYNYFLSGVLIAGIVLLVAVIGAITLTFNFNSHRKNQVISRQLSRAIVCIRRFRS